MKKFLALLIATAMVFVLAACSDSQNSDASGDGASETVAPAATEASAPQTIAEDTTAISLSFTPPEGYDTVARHIGKATDGTLVDKDFTYTFSDKSELVIGYSKGKQMTDELPQSYLDDAETVTYADKPFTVITQGKTIMALYQDGDVLYGIGYSFSDEIDRDAFDKIMNGVGITDNTETVENGDELYDIRYTIDSSAKVSRISNTLTEKPDGTPVKKIIQYNIGEDEDHLDYRFLICVYKDSTVEKELPEDRRTEQVELGGVSYTAVYDSETAEKPYEYFTRHGDDVYMIRNSGITTGWSVTRSDESYEAFEKLMNSVKFE